MLHKEHINFYPETHFYRRNCCRFEARPIKEDDVVRPLPALPGVNANAFIWVCKVAEFWFVNYFFIYGKTSFCFILIYNFTSSSQKHKDKRLFWPNFCCFYPKCHSVCAKGLGYIITNKAQKFQILDDWQNYVLLVVSLKKTSFSQKTIFVNTKKVNGTRVPF